MAKISLAAATSLHVDLQGHYLTKRKARVSLGQIGTKGTSAKYRGHTDIITVVAS